MPIEIFTGLPGAGKTSWLIDRMLAEGEKKNARPLVAAGINGLQPGLATMLDDPRKWAEITDYEQGPCRCPLVGGDIQPDGKYQAHTHRIPHGALIFIDEAWKWFGHLHDASRQPTPKHVLDLAEHRHMGVDFVWTSQGPNQIYPFARSLIASHTHLVRKWGTKFVEHFTWGELQDDVKSPARREQAQRSTKALPERAQGKYQSSEEHTIKAKIPWKVYAIPVMLAVAVLFGWLAYTKIKPDTALIAEAEAASSGLPEPPPGHYSSGRQAERIEPLTPTEYAQRHLPRFATMPWTAQIFDERPAVSDPQLYCMASGPGRNGSGEWKEGGCHCVTEQGTQYDIGEGECRRVARWGTPYNPYRERREQGQDRSQPGELAAAGGRRGAPAPRRGGGIAGSAPQPMVASEFGTLTRPSP